MRSDRAVTGLATAMVSFMALFPAGRGSAAVLRTQAGGVELGFDGETGRIVELEAGGRSYWLDRAAPVSGFALWDHATDEGWQPLQCYVQEFDGDLRFSGKGPDLTLWAEMRSGPRGWQIFGSVTRAGGERFLSLRFGLPVKVEGWTFWKDVVRGQEMEADEDYDNATPNGLGSGWIDFLPMVAMSCDSTALAYAVRMDEQWFHHCAYRAQEGLFSFVQDFALLDGQTHFERIVPFNFYLLAPAGRWGLRAVIEAYFARFPQWSGEREGPEGALRQPLAHPGGWVAWGDLAVHSPPLCDFGMYYHEGPTPSGYATDEALGYVSLPYIEPSMYQQYHGDLDRAPTREEAYDRLAHNASADPSQVQHATLDRARRQWIHDISKAILQSAICTPEGQPIAPTTGNWPWIGGTNYGAQFPLNLEPGIEGGVGQVRLEECRRALAHPSADGMYLDSYCAHFGVVDYSHPNVLASHVPPTFNADRVPCVTVWSSLFPWVEKLRQLLGPDQQCVLPNIYGIAGPSPWHCFEVIGKESWASPTGALMARCRQLGYHKVVSQLPDPSNPHQEYDFLKQLLLFDVIPGGYGNQATSAPESMRDSYRKLLPLFRLLHRLMWQPITHAWGPGPGLLVERYGNPPGAVVFVVTNGGEPQVARVTIASPVVPGGVEAWCEDPLQETPLNWEWEGENLVVSVGLDQGQTAVFVVGDRAAQQDFRIRWTADRWDDVQLCFREYRLRKQIAHPLSERAAELALALPASLPLQVRAGRRVTVQEGWEEELPKIIAELRQFTQELTPEDEMTARAQELGEDAADRLESCLELEPAQPAEGIQVQAKPVSSVALPWGEEFDGPVDEQKWEIQRGNGRVDFADGKAWLELQGSTEVHLKHRTPFDFGRQPMVLETRFRNDSVPGWWYVGTFFYLSPIVGRDDYLNVRIDNGRKIRMENGETSASNYTKALFNYLPLESDVPHEMRLYLDRTHYRLEMDGKLLSEGRHHLTFTRGYLSLNMYSGHRGHGDVWEVDYVRMREAPKDERSQD